MKPKKKLIRSRETIEPQRDIENSTTFFEKNIYTPPEYYKIKEALQEKDKEKFLKEYKNFCCFDLGRASIEFSQENNSSSEIQYLIRKPNYYIEALKKIEKIEPLLKKHEIENMLLTFAMIIEYLKPKVLNEGVFYIQDQEDYYAQTVKKENIIYSQKSFRVLLNLVQKSLPLFRMADAQCAIPPSPQCPAFDKKSLNLFVNSANKGEKYKMFLPEIPTDPEDKIKALANAVIEKVQAFKEEHSCKLNVIGFGVTEVFKLYHKSVTFFHYALEGAWLDIARAMPNFFSEYYCYLYSEFDKELLEIRPKARIADSLGRTSPDDTKLWADKLEGKYLGQPKHKCDKAKKTDVLYSIAEEYEETTGNELKASGREKLRAWWKKHYPSRFLRPSK